LKDSPFTYFHEIYFKLIYFSPHSLHIFREIKRNSNGFFFLGPPHIPLAYFVAPKCKSLKAAEKNVTYPSPTKKYPKNKTMQLSDAFFFMH